MKHTRLRQTLAACTTGRGGNVGLIFALILPAILVTGLGAMELSQVLSDKKRTQDVADSAALMGAGQLAVSPVGADQRAQAFAKAQLADVAAASQLSVQATVGAGREGPTMTVAVDTQRTSFFGNLLPPGGFHTHVSATAAGVNTTPLCVLTTGAGSANPLHLSGVGSSLEAGECLVHADASVQVDAGAKLLASATEAGGSASGVITPLASTGAPSIADPFSSLAVDAACSSSSPKATTVSTTTTLQPQTFSGAVTVNGGATALNAITVTLAPGEYYFCKTLSVNNLVTLTGSDVVLVFAKGAAMTFGGLKPLNMGLVTSAVGPSLSLRGRQSGPLAGFALIADRTYAGDFVLQTDYITELTGTVYAPTSNLHLEGTVLSGSASPWTVVTAKGINMTGGVQLVVNSNYSASSVPVPKGVGPNRGGGSQLTQ